MTDKPLTFAIIGASAGIAESHLDAIKNLPGAKIVGMQDVAPERATKRAAEFGCPFFADHKKMLAETKPDVAVITTPHPFHAPIALDAFAAGCHVHTEKPVAVEVAQADLMIAAADKAGKILSVNYQKRFWRGTEYMRKVVEQNELGELIRVLCIEPWYRTEAYYKSATWRGTWAGEGGGVLMNQAPHTLDLLCHLAGLPKKVWGWVRTRYHSMECEDSAQAMLEYPNGAPGYLTVSTVEAGVETRLQLIGEKGGLEMVGNKVYRFTFGTPLLEFMRTSQEMWSGPKQEKTEIELTTGPDGNHLDCYKDLAAAIREKRQPRVTGKEALMSMELANAIVLSSFEDRAVTLPTDRAAYSALLNDLKSGKRILGKGR